MGCPPIKENPTIDYMGRKVNIELGLIKGIGNTDEFQFDVSIQDFLTYNDMVFIYDGVTNWAFGASNIAWMTFKYYEVTE
jgi:hypothetical protein